MLEDVVTAARSASTHVGRLRTWREVAGDRKARDQRELDQQTRRADRAEHRLDALRWAVRALEYMPEGAERQGALVVGLEQHELRTLVERHLGNLADRFPKGAKWGERLRLHIEGIEALPFVLCENLPEFERQEGNDEQADRARYEVTGIARGTMGCVELIIQRNYSGVPF